MPIYIVKESGLDSDGKPAVIERLVDAGTQTAALRHCTSPRFTAKAASPEDVGRLMGDGAKIEKPVKAEPAATPEAE